MKGVVRPLFPCTLILALCQAVVTPDDFQPALAVTAKTPAPGQYRLAHLPKSFWVGQTHNWTIIVPFGKDRPRELLVWFIASDSTGRPSTIFSAPALESGDPSARYVQARFMHAGVYKMHVLASWKYPVSLNHEGSTGTGQRNLQVSGSPWTIRVEKSSTIAAISGTSGYRPCISSNAFADLRGRWVKCNQTPIGNGCLRDGWIFMPDLCSPVVHVALEVLAFAEKFWVQKGKVLSVVILGTSIARGAYHAFLDAIASQLGREGSRVQEFMFGGHIESVPGVGDTVKCWGWSDTQIGKLRLSYQEWRTDTLLLNQTRKAIGMNRLHQIMSGQPDLIFLEMQQKSKEEDIAVHVTDIFFVMNASGFHGRLVFAFQLPRLKGPISQCYPPHFESMVRKEYANSTTPAVDCHSAVVKSIRLNEHKFPHLRGRVVHIDYDIMAWSFLFNMERPLSYPYASQHFHTVRYSMSGTRKRFIVGAVPEMLAHILIDSVMQQHDFGPMQVPSAMRKLDFQYCFSCERQLDTLAGMSAKYTLSNFSPSPAALRNTDLLHRCGTV